METRRIPVISRQANAQDAKTLGTCTTLSGHTGIVNAVKWVPGRGEAEEIIVSGSADHTVRIWKEENGEV